MPRKKLSPETRALFNSMFAGATKRKPRKKRTKTDYGESYTVVGYTKTGKPIKRKTK